MNNAEEIIKRCSERDGYILKSHKTLMLTNTLSHFENYSDILIQ